LHAHALARRPLDDAGITLAARKIAGITPASGSALTEEAEKDSTDTGSMRIDTEARPFHRARHPGAIIAAVRRGHQALDHSG
jgi:hypothetical protein